MTLPGVYPRVQDGNLGYTAPIGNGVRAVVGVCSLGVANQVYTLTDPERVPSLLGRGPLADYVVTQLAQAGGTVYAVPVAGSIAGAVTPLAGNPNTNVALTGTAKAALDVQVVITKSGTVGNAEFVYSLDGGDTLSPAIATAASYTLPGVGHAVTFAPGTYVQGTAWRFAVTPPAASMADVQAAVRALLNAPLSYEYIHVAQPGDNALWTMLDVLAGEAQNMFRYIHITAEAPAPLPGETADVWTARLLGLIATFSSSTKRVLVVAQYGEVVDPQGLLQVRNWAAHFGARVSRIPVSENPGWVDGGNIPGVVVTAPFDTGPFGKSSQYNNGHAAALEAAGYTVAYTLRDRPGYYWVEGRLAVPAESDFAILPNRRVMDQAVAGVRRASLGSVQRKVDPVDLVVSLDHLTNVWSVPLDRMRANKDVSGGRIEIVPGQNVLSTRQLILRIFVTPMGYLREIYEDFSFENPLFAPTVTNDATAAAATPAPTPTS